MTEAIIGVVALVVGCVIGFPLGIRHRKNVSEREISSAEEEARRIINDAIKSAESKKREALLEAKEEILKSRSEYERVALAQYTTAKTLGQARYPRKVRICSTASYPRKNILQ